MAKRITTAELAAEIKVIKENHLVHLSQDIVELKEELKESRTTFQQRLDRLDNRIWAIVLLSLGTLLSTIFSMMI